ncbi:MAG: acetyltransferase [Nevskia sp.]|nr:acetyltransferase [Nevskia sp.]
MPLLNAPAVRSVVIAGAGGFALEMFDYLLSERDGPEVLGFIDDRPEALPPPGTGRPHLGRIDAYRPAADQGVVVAIGSPQGRSNVLNTLWQLGAVTPAYVHPLALVSPAARLGRGTIVCPYAIVNRNASVGDGVLVNVHCCVGHGAAAGDFSVLSPYADLNGDSAIGAGCFLGTRATLFPRVTIGRECVVDSHTAVRASAEDRQIISSRGPYTVNPRRT